MRYQHFADLGMFTGSGAIEGGIKAIVVQRAKLSGMHWTVAGADGIIHPALPVALWGPSRLGGCRGCFAGYGSRPRLDGGACWAGVA